MRYKEQVETKLASIEDMVENALHGIESRQVNFDQLQTILQNIHRINESAKGLVDLESED